MSSQEFEQIDVLGLQVCVPLILMSRLRVLGVESIPISLMSNIVCIYSYMGPFMIGVPRMSV